MEAGIFNYGNDMDITNNPFEMTGLERLVELDNDNEFVSRDALRADRGRRRAAEAGRREDRRRRRSRCGSRTSGRWSKGRTERSGGCVSASYSPRLDFNMGYAWVPIAAATEGTRIEITSPDGPMTATVIALPFLDPKKEIPAKG